MALGVGLRCIKYSLFVFNLLFVLFAIAFIVVGSYALNVGRQLGWVSSPTAVGVFIITIGVIIFIISFFGCCGAARESYCLIVSFAVSLTLIFALQLAVGIFGVVSKNNIDKQLPSILNATMSTYSSAAGILNGWDFVQTMFACCGVNGPLDWQNRLVNASNSVPDSCCLVSRRNTTCGSNVLTQQANWGNLINTAGCYSAVSNSLSSSVVVIGIIAIVLCIIQLVAITCASCLAHEIHNQYEPL